MTENKVDEFVFDSLLPQEFPVTFGKEKFVLCEMNGETDVWFKETMVSISKFNMETNKPTSAEGINKLDSETVGRCLFRAPKTETSVPVGIEFVLKLGAAAIGKMAQKVYQMSGFNSNPEDKSAKNSQPATALG